MNSLGLIAMGPFLSSAMLLWGIAALIPIAIHLLSKRKYHVTSWAAVRFLLAAVQKNSRRIRIEQWLLLAVRVLILLLLAVALAEPVWSRLGGLLPSVTGGSETHFVLVLDGSYSMGYREGNQTRFQRGQDVALEIIENSKQGDAFSLIVMGDPPQILIGEPTSDRGSVIDEIRQLRVGHGGADLRLSLAAVEQAVSKAKKDYSRLTAHQVCWITDLGRNTWAVIEENDCRKQALQASENASQFLVNVGQPEFENYAISSLTASDDFITENQDVTLQAQVQDFGLLNRTLAAPRSVNVSCFADGELVEQQLVTIGSDDIGVATFRHRFADAGEHMVHVRISDDPLVVDNQRWLSVPVRPAIKVLCLAGKFGAARHVALALNPGNSPDGRIQVSVEPAQTMMERDLSQFDCLIACNVSRFTQQEQAAIRKHLQRGGGFITFLGDQVQAEHYNLQLAEANDTRILPATLTELISEPHYALDPLEYRHPIVASFRGHERSGLLGLAVWTHFRLAPVDAKNARTVAQLSQQSPLLIEENIGGGISVLCATAASSDSVNGAIGGGTPWTAMSVFRNFPTLVNDVVNYSVKHRQSHRNAAVGDLLTGKVPLQLIAQPVTVACPGDRREIVSPAVDDRWSFAETRESGIYTAEYGGDDGPREKFSVNLDTQEGDLTGVDPEALPTYFVQDADFANAGSEVAAANQQSKLFRAVLLLVLVLVVAETTLASWFGRGV